MSGDPNDRGFGDEMIATQQRERDFGSTRTPHSGPAIGRNDLLIACIMLGGFLGLLRGGDIGALVGIVIGVVVGFLLRFVLNLPFRIAAFFIDRHRLKNGGVWKEGYGPKAKSDPNRPKSVNEQIDWKAYEREKKRREKEEARRK